MVHTKKQGDAIDEIFKITVVSEFEGSNPLAEITCKGVTRRNRGPIVPNGRLSNQKVKSTKSKPDYEKIHPSRFCPWVDHAPKTSRLVAKS
jgi:hypothetical protein